MPFERVWHEEMANLFQLLRKNHFMATAKEVWEQFPEECATAHEKGASMEPDPMCLATLQIKARLHAAFFVSSPDVSRTEGVISSDEVWYARS